MTIRSTLAKAESKWLGLALAFFLLASLLGYWVSGMPLHSKDANSSFELEVLTSAAGRLTRLPYLGFSLPSEKGRFISSAVDIDVHLVIEAPSGHPPRLVMSEVKSCKMQQPQDQDVKIVPFEGSRLLRNAAKGQEPFVDDLSQIDIPADTASPTEAIEMFIINCETSWKPEKDSFSGRVLEVSARSILDGSFGGDESTAKDTSKSPYDSSGPFLLGFKGIRNQTGFRAFGGSVPTHDQISEGEGRRLDDDGDIVTMVWEDSQAAAIRDLMLIVVGALYGLAGASLIEWLKAR